MNRKPSLALPLVLLLVVLLTPCAIADSVVNQNLAVSEPAAGPAAGPAADSVASPVADQLRDSGWPLPVVGVKLFIEKNCSDSECLKSQGRLTLRLLSEVNLPENRFDMYFALCALAKDSFKYV